MMSKRYLIISVFLIIGIICIGLINLDQNDTVDLRSLAFGETGFQISLNTSLPNTNINSLPCYSVIEAQNIHLDAPLSYNKNELPSEEEAISLAEEYLLQNDAYPEDAFIKGASYSYRTCFDENGSVLWEKPISICVKFERLINNFSVVGNGDLILFSVDEYGELKYCSKYWREIEIAGVKNIINSEQAYNKLVNGDFVNPGQPYSESTDFIIEDIYLSYYSYDYTINQDYYNPVWIFSGTLDNETPYFLIVEAT